MTETNNNTSETQVQQKVTHLAVAVDVIDTIVEILNNSKLVNTPDSLTTGRVASAIVDLLNGPKLTVTPPVSAPEAPALAPTPEPASTAPAKPAPVLEALPEPTCQAV